MDMFDLPAGSVDTSGRRTFDFDAYQRTMDWFRLVYGYREVNTDDHATCAVGEMWAKNQRMFTIERHTTYPFGLPRLPADYTVLRSTVAKGPVIAAGEFHERGVPELRCIIREQRERGIGVQGPVTVRHRVVNDCRRLHGLAARHRAGDRRAMLQAASQFNYLEMPNPQATPSYGLTRHYMCDPRVQGPRCATATPGATWLRNWVLTTGNAESQQCNGLRAVMDELNAGGRFVAMANGYALADADLLAAGAALSLTGDALDKMVEERLKIAFSIDAEVLTIDRPDDAPADGRGYVANAWCSAVPWVHSAEGAQGQLLGLGRAVLKASYKATLLGAIAHRMDVVYLTSVGGGVWGNSAEMIADAINAAVREAGHFGRRLEVVILHFKQLEHKQRNGKPGLAKLVNAQLDETAVDPL